MENPSYPPCPFYLWFYPAACVGLVAIYEHILGQLPKPMYFLLGFWCGVLTLENVLMYRAEYDDAHENDEEESL